MNTYEVRSTNNRIRWYGHVSRIKEEIGLITKEDSIVKMKRKFPREK
jgi:hypothetical protein